MLLAGSQGCPLIPPLLHLRGGDKITVALAKGTILRVGSFLPGMVFG
jgi:hypothetical protein